MNAQLSTNLRRIGLPAFSVGMGILLAGAAIVAATLSHPVAPARRDAVRPALQTSVNVPISGTGSAYDGKHYGSVAPQTSVNVPISGTGSAYDGKHYGGFEWAPRSSANVNVPISGTGSAYDGR